MSPPFSATFAKVADYGFAMDRERYEGIQIARALAALGVCYFHSWGALDRFPKGTAHPIPWLAEYGWLGVDLFFAVSGFVICMVVSRSDFDPRSFLIRRVFRLYPLWLLMLTLFAVMAWQWRGLLPTETAGNFVYSATLLPTENFPFYDIGWSLQHEMMFYLLVVVVVPFFGVMGLIAALCASSRQTSFSACPGMFRISRSTMRNFSPAFSLTWQCRICGDLERWLRSPLARSVFTTFCFIGAGDRFSQSRCSS